MPSSRWLVPVAFSPAADAKTGYAIVEAETAEQAEAAARRQRGALPPRAWAPTPKDWREIRTRRFEDLAADLEFPARTLATEEGDEV